MDINRSLPEAPSNSISLKELEYKYTIYKHCLIWDSTSIDEQKLNKDEIKYLLSNSCSWMIRNCYDWDCGKETNFWEIICDEDIPIEKLPSKTRNQIRRSLRDCDIRRINRQNMIEDDAYKVFMKAFERYKNITQALPSREMWESNLKERNNIEYWGVYKRDNGQLIAWALNVIKVQSVDYSTLKAIPEFMNKHYPYFGLLYKMNKYYLGEKGYLYVSDGWRSITEHSGIQPFLEKNFLFRKSYCKMRVYYKFWMGILIKILYPFRHLRVLPLKVRNMLKFEEINRQSC